MTAQDPTTARRLVVVLAAMLAVFTAGAVPVSADTGTTTTTSSTTTTTSSATTTSTTPPTSSPQTTTTPTTSPQATTSSTAPTTTSSSSTTTSSTAPSTTATTISPAQLAALLSSLNLDLAKASAINSFVQAKAAAAAAEAGQPSPPASGADAGLVKVAAAQLAATRAKETAQRRFDTARHRLGRMGVALYVHDDTAGDSSSVSLSDGTAIDRSILLSILLGEAKTELTTAKRTLSGAIEALTIARVEADAVVAARAAAIEAQAQQAAAAVAATSTTAPPTGTTVAGPAGHTSTTKASRPARTQTQTASPTILGPAALTGAELNAWFTSGGHQPKLTVPLNTLTGYYQSTGATMGVRDDIAFAQAMVETGYFSFPAFGQVAVTDNNYAGIGACDSCTRGLQFPDAKTGVAAQLQLLHDYASRQPIPGPLPPTAGVSGCCSTWLALTGVWATANGYGYNILVLYRQMLEWTLQRRQVGAGL